MENPFHYRNKVHAVVDRDKKGNVITGVYKAGTHMVVPVDSCMIEDEKADEIIVTIRGMLKSFKIKTCLIVFTSDSECLKCFCFTFFKDIICVCMCVCVCMCNTFTQC